jgi:hypothetical protein
MRHFVTAGQIWCRFSFCGVDRAIFKNMVTIMKITMAIADDIWLRAKEVAINSDIIIYSNRKNSISLEVAKSVL